MAADANESRDAAYLVAIVALAAGMALAPLVADDDARSVQTIDEIATPTRILHSPTPRRFLSQPDAVRGGDPSPLPSARPPEALALAPDGGRSITTIAAAGSEMTAPAVETPPAPDERSATPSSLGAAPTAIDSAGTTTTARTPTATSPATAAPPPSTAPPTTSLPTTTAPTTSPPTTTPPTTAPRRSSSGSLYIAPSAPTAIPVYDTAWQMLVRGTPAQADEYFAALARFGFTGAWAGVIHHAPATYNADFAGGGRVGHLVGGEVVLTDAYIEHVRTILDAADRHRLKVGLVVAWQNLYLPGGGADAGIPTSDGVRGTITTNNAYAYGRQMATAFGDHPAVSMWVFGGDAGTNNTEANKAVWRQMARGLREAGSSTEITYHTPTSEFDQLNYAGEDWLDFIAPETGHAQDAATTEHELRSAARAYGIPVWQGEPRYFNIDFGWVNAAFRNPGVAEVRADAQAAENAGVAGYVYGDAGRWTWCAGYGDSTPCRADDIAASFGEGERAVIEVFS